MEATIVIPQHRHAELTLACIESLRDVDPVPWPIIVVDDGSPDDAACQVQQADNAGVTLIRQGQLGVTAAWNRGAREAASEYLIFLNNDVLSLGPWVKPLVTPLRTRAAVITGVAWRAETLLPRHLLDALSAPRFLEGWCLAMRTETYRASGGFDEQLSIYFSDTDLQARLWQTVEPATMAQSLVRGLPLRHLGHRTAHDVRCLADRRTKWRADRDSFVKKWANRCLPTVADKCRCAHEETSDVQTAPSV